jgi:nicotinamidase-related amidase
MRTLTVLLAAALVAFLCHPVVVNGVDATGDDALPADTTPAGEIQYDNQLTPIANPRPLLAEAPDFVEPLVEINRFSAAAVVDEPGADLAVRAWRFSYNARGIVEFPNRIRAKHTAMIVVHPWGIDDKNGWKSPEPAGVALCCTPEKNRIYNRHVAEIINPLLKKLRGQVGLVAYSLPNKEDAVRKQLYRSVRSTPTAADRTAGAAALKQTLAKFNYHANPVDAALLLDPKLPASSYMKKFPGIDSSAKFNGEGFWQLPIPVASAIDVAPEDVVFYDAEGYPVLRDFLVGQKIQNVLLCGYNTDMCVCSTTAGYENLSKDFNVFLVGDATIATFPGSNTPRYATQTALCKASLTQLVTQRSWIETLPSKVSAK